MESSELAPTEPCRCCGEPAAFLWRAPLLGRPVAYFECPHCAYVQTMQPDWLEQAYDESINLSDTGILWRNQHNVAWVVTTLHALGHLPGQVVDFAGGYGLLVRQLRDVGIDARWMDRFSANLVARGFEWQPGERADLVTAFEAFEHFVHPGAELAAMLAIAPNVLLSTNLIPRPTPSQSDWWYYGVEHGQHIGFFRLASLQHLAARFGKVVVSNGLDFHLITDPGFPAWRWRLLTRLRKLLDPVLRRGLSSLTLQDHQRMVDSLAGAPVLPVIRSPAEAVPQSPARDA